MISSQLVSEAMKKEFGSFFSTEAHKTNDLVRYINSAMRYICTAYNFEFNKYRYDFTTNGIDTEYVIPYQIETFFVQVNDGDELNILPFEEYFREKDKNGYVCLLEDKIHTTQFNSKHTIYYRGYPDIITDLNGSIDAPEHFFDAVVLAATYYGFLDIKAYNHAGTKKNILDGLLKSLAVRSSDKRPLDIKRTNKSNSPIF